MVITKEVVNVILNNIYAEIAVDPEDQTDTPDIYANGFANGVLFALHEVKRNLYHTLELTPAFN